MKKLRIYRIDSCDGEIHLVIDETSESETSDCLVDVTEIKKISKRDAAKPLTIVRDE
jgi:hypothetical protein